MNIVLYVNSFLPVLGGKEFVVHHLANALTQLGHRVRVLGPAGCWKHRKQKLRYPVHRWPTLRGLLFEQVAMSQLMLDTALWGCDIVHAHTTYPNGYTALRLKGIKDLPLVITPHGADIQSIPELGHGLRLNPVLNKKIMRAVKGAELVTAISKNIETGLIDAGAEKGRIRLIPNGVDLGRFSRLRSEQIRGWLGVTQDARLIVTIGRYNPRKGQDYLVRAMPMILAREPRARLVIVGNGTDTLLPLIGELGLQGKVVLTGGITPTQEVLVRTDAPASASQERDYLAELLCSSELYVSAGIQNNAEGLSLAVLESMAAGLPIVATAISGNTDVVTHGENGFLVQSRERDRAGGGGSAGPAAIRGATGPDEGKGA